MNLRDIWSYELNQAEKLAKSQTAIIVVVHNRDFPNFVKTLMESTENEAVKLFHFFQTSQKSC